MAEMLPPDPNGGDGSPFWSVVAGLVAGAIWRAPSWFSKQGIKSGLFVRDAASFGVLGITSMVICKIFGLTGEYAALTGAAVTIVGVDAIRKYAMEVFAQWMKRRYGVDVKIEQETE